MLYSYINKELLPLRYLSALFVCLVEVRKLGLPLIKPATWGYDRGYSTPLNFMFLGTGYIIIVFVTTIFLHTSLSVFSTTEDSMFGRDHG